MPWTPSAAGIGTARLVKLQAIIQAGITDLNSTLAADTNTAYMVTDPWPVMTSGSVRIGDTAALWPSTSEGLVKISVMAGDLRGGLDFQATPYYAAGDGSVIDQETYFTSVLAIVHPDAFRDMDPVHQAFVMEIARERVSDWLRASVLNNRANQTLTLTSQERETGVYDVLQQCRATLGLKAFFDRAYGNHTAFGVHFQHSATIL